MSKVTHVKHAQQRYATKPVLDDGGTSKVVPVTRKDGTPKTTKKGKVIVRRLSERDLSKPLPNHKCDKCQAEIKVGDPYKWIAPKSGPYGGSKRFRCGTCPSWQVWEYSYSLGARLAEISYHAWNDFNAVTDDADGIREALASVAESVRGLAEEKGEGADNIESGFGHETSQSEELRDTAQQLNDWADEIENTEVPDYPEGVDELGPAEDEIDSWGAEAEAVFSIVDECPV